MDLYSLELSLFEFYLNVWAHFVIVAHFAQSYYYPKSNYGVQINESAGNKIKYVNQHA